MEQFKEYLQQMRYRESTIKEHVQNIGYFLQWVNDNQLYEMENVQHKNVLEYVQHEQKRNIDVSTINLRLSSISKYFDYLKTENIITRNPARTLRIKGKLKTITEQPLKYAELEQLYFAYKQLNKEAANNVKEAVELAHQRNIIVVGLLVWQGLHSGELEKLEVNHINLDEGKIYIPSTARSNSRELKLHVQQVIHLHSYLHGGIREKLKSKNDQWLDACKSGVCRNSLYRRANSDFPEPTPPVINWSSPLAARFIASEFNFFETSSAFFFVVCTSVRVFDFERRSVRNDSKTRS